MMNTTTTMRMAALLAAIAVGIAAIGARQRHDRNAEADTRKADYIFLEGQRQNQTGHPDAYYELLKRAHELDSSDKYVGMELGYMRMRLARGDSAEMAQGYQLMADYADSNPDDFYGCVLFAAVSSQIGRNDRAIDVWGRLHNAQPHRPELTLRLAEALTAEGSDSALAKAGLLYDSLWTSEGPSVRLAQMMVQLHYQQGDTAAMIADARRLVNAAPGVVDYNIFAGNVEMDLGDTDSALVMLGVARMITPPDDTELLSDIATARGDARYAKGDLDSAFADYSQALALNPENMTALNNCAYYLACENRDLDRAMDMILKVVAARPEEATSLDTYAWVLFMKKEYEQAREAIDNALAHTDDPSAELYEHAGDIYFMDRKPQEAVAFWKKALQLDPENETLARKIRLKNIYTE